jgi:hypothetical protein
MADKTIAFGASAAFGAVTGWEEQNTSDSTANARAVALNSEGEEAAATLHDEKQDVSATYKCVSDTNTIPATIGAIVNALNLTSIAINTVEGDYATMTLAGHNHTENAHEAVPALHQVAHAITLAACFGVTDFTGDSAGTNDSCIASSITISCEHTDQNDGAGDHLVGENHGGKIEIKSTYCGDHTVVATGYDVTVTSSTDENTGFIKKEVTAVKKLTLA